MTPHEVRWHVLCYTWFKFNFGIYPCCKIHRCEIFFYFEINWVLRKFLEKKDLQHVSNVVSQMSFYGSVTWLRKLMWLVRSDLITQYDNFTVLAVHGDCVNILDRSLFTVGDVRTGTLPTMHRGANGSEQ